MREIALHSHQVQQDRTLHNRKVQQKIALHKHRLQQMQRLTLVSQLAWLCLSSVAGEVGMIWSW
jgi:hypothetical protein